MDVKSPSLNDYLCGEVFFNAAKYPDMRFLSTNVEKRDEQHAEVTGDLTMLGVTKPISLDVEVTPKLAGTNKRLGFKATGAINRLDYGMSFGYPIISDLIHLTVTTEAELRRIFGDGVNQAADLVSGATSIPSRNLTPLMTFGNWL